MCGPHQYILLYIFFTPRPKKNTCTHILYKKKMLVPIVEHVMRLLIFAPVEWMIRRAPEALGGWEGLEDDEICARLTGVPGNVWTASPNAVIECELRIDRSMGGKHAIVAMLVYVMFVWYVVRCILVAPTVVLNRLSARPPAIGAPPPIAPPESPILQTDRILLIGNGNE